MRYYLTETIGGSLFVIGEIVGGTDYADGSAFPHPTAPSDGTLTREQLLELSGGRRALWDWERGDASRWQAAYDADRHVSNVSNVRELAEAGNPWARDLNAAGFPEPETAIFLGGDRAFPDWRPQLV